MHQEDKEHDAGVISSLMSVFMTIAALVYVFVMNMYLKPEEVTWIMMTPPTILLVLAVWFLIKPAKVEW